MVKGSHRKHRKETRPVEIIEASRYNEKALQLKSEIKGKSGSISTPNRCLINTPILNLITTVIGGAK
jgi:hypothetical protein